MLANSHKQLLHEHLYAVAVLASHIASFKTSNTDIQKCCFVAGLHHDVGKVDLAFQSWVSKSKKEHAADDSDNGQHIDKGSFSFENHARHNELSTWAFAILAGADRSSKKQFLKDSGFKGHDLRLIDIIKHAIFWHHAKPLRKQDFQDLGAIRKKSINAPDVFLNNVNEMISEIKSLSSQYHFDSFQICLDDLDDVIEDLDKEPIPPYKHYRDDHNEVELYLSEVEYNNYCNIVRSCVIGADKLVSSLTAAKLSEMIQKNELTSLFNPHAIESVLCDAINEHSVRFYPDSERTLMQIDAAARLAKKEGVSALSGAAGCGKTKIAIEWAKLRSAKKLYWIVPRVTVALGLFNEISSSDYLPECKIEIFTGDYKLTRQHLNEYDTRAEDYLSGDVVITTIDQLVNAVSTHRNINIFTDFMLNHAVFDEFHEFVNMDAFNLLFAEIVHSKKNKPGASDLLLVSATPHYTYCNALLEIAQSDFVEMPSTNTSRYAIKFESFSDETPKEAHPLFRKVNANTIVISNTATRAQLSYLHNYENECSILFHSKLASADRKALFTSVFNAFKRNGDTSFDVLRAAPVVQASLNITSRHMISEASTPENLLQRLGRLDRFSEFSAINLFVIALPKSVETGKIIDNEARFLNSLNAFHTTVSWMAFLSEHSLSDLSINDIYAIYKAFHQKSCYQQIILSDLLSALKQSAKSIQNRLSDPLWIKPKKERTPSDLLKKVSLRGDSRYVQMIAASFKNGLTSLHNEYALTEDNTMTLSLSELDNGDDSVLNFMSRKHHQITGDGNKYENNSSRLKESSRSKENPIFTSYPPEALRIVNEINQESSLVYLSTEKQAVGCIRLKTLNSALS